MPLAVLGEPERKACVKEDCLKANVLNVSLDDSAKKDVIVTALQESVNDGCILSACLPTNKPHVECSGLERTPD